MAPRRPDREPALRPRPTLDFDPGPVAPWVAGRARARLPWPRPSARLRPPSGPAPRPGRPRPRDECCVERARGSQYPRPRRTGRQYPAPRPVSTRWHTGRQCPRAAARQYPVAHRPSVPPRHYPSVPHCSRAVRDSVSPADDPFLLQCAGPRPTARDLVRRYVLVRPAGPARVHSHAEAVAHGGAGAPTVPGPTDARGSRPARPAWSESAAAVPDRLTLGGIGPRDPLGPPRPSRTD